MKISVIIPTYNEEKNIGKCIKSLLNQTIHKEDYEIIVVDGKSKDKTTEIANKLGAKVIKQKSNGVGGARNDGVEISKSEIIATTDADTILPENWLETILKNFKKNIVCVFGPLKPAKKTLFYNLIFYLRDKIIYSLSRTNIFHNICGSNSGFRKKEFLKVSGFNPELTSSDDVEISMRLKKYGSIYFDKNMICFYSTRRIEKFGFFKTNFEWMKNSFNVLRKKPRKNKYARQEYD